MKTYRVYYNKTSAYPFIWSCDEGTIETEINVVNVVFDNTSGITKYDSTADNTDNPRAWFEVEGVLTLKDSVAYISAS